MDKMSDNNDLSSDKRTLRGLNAENLDLRNVIAKINNDVSRKDHIIEQQELRIQDLETDLGTIDKICSDLREAVEKDKTAEAHLQLAEDQYLSLKNENEELKEKHKELQDEHRILNWEHMQTQKTADKCAEQHKTQTHQVRGIEKKFTEIKNQLKEAQKQSLERKDYLHEKADGEFMQSAQYIKEVLEEKSEAEEHWKLLRAKFEDDIDALQAKLQEKEEALQPMLEENDDLKWTLIQRDLKEHDELKETKEYRVGGVSLQEEANHSSAQEVVDEAKKWPRESEEPRQMLHRGGLRNTVSINITTHRFKPMIWYSLTFLAVTSMLLAYYSWDQGFVAPDEDVWLAVNEKAERLPFEMNRSQANAIIQETLYPSATGFPAAEYARKLYDNVVPNMLSRFYP